MVALCYFAVGLALAAGAGALIKQDGQLTRSRPVAIAQVVVGMGPVAISFLFDSKKAKARSRERAAAGAASTAAVVGVIVGLEGFEALGQVGPA